MRLATPPRRQTMDGTIPLINVVFLLLMFFLFAGTVAPDPAREIEPPVTRANDPDERAMNALVVDADGTTTMGGTPVTVAEAAARFNALPEEPARQGARIVADRRLPANRLTEIIAGLTQAGAGRIGLITRKGS